MARTAQKRGFFMKRGSSSPISRFPGFLRSRRGIILVSVILLVALVGGGLIFWLLTPKKASADKPIVGHVYFVSSDQLKQGENWGLSDQLLIDLRHLPDPAPGKSYHAWLLSEKARKPMLAIFLGTLPVDHGTAHLLYLGDQHHINLVDVMGRFLVTEEAAGQTLTQPTPNTASWRYYREFATIPNPDPTDAPEPDPHIHGNFLLDLRILLSENIYDAQKVQIYAGGLGTPFLRNTQKVWEWALSARDAWSPTSPDLNFI